jgi:hypothetical protein
MSVAVMFFCCHLKHSAALKNNRFKHRGSGLGAPCPSLLLEVDSSISLPTTPPTLLITWSRVRPSRVV